MIDKKLEEDMKEVLEARCYGTCLQKHRKHQEPSANRHDVCQSRQGTV